MQRTLNNWWGSLACFAVGIFVCAVAAWPTSTPRGATLQTAQVIPSFPVFARWTFAADANGQPTRDKQIELCQWCPPAPRQLLGVDCQSWTNPCKEPGWKDARPVPFEQYSHGEFIGPSRVPLVPIYIVRVADRLDFIYRFTHERIAESYRLMVGDVVMVETFPQDEGSIRRGDFQQGNGLQVQPDGTIYFPYLEPVTAAGRTIIELRNDIEKQLTDSKIGAFNDGTIRVVVTPLKTNTRLEDLRASVAARFGAGGQTQNATVAADGTVQLIGLGSVPAQGLSLDELQAEINARYVSLVGVGVEVSVILNARAPRFVWVVGEVVQGGQFELTQPTTVVQAISLARGFNVGGNVREVVVFRRDEHWQLMATRIDVRGVFLGKTPFPSDDIWLRDDDVVVVPKGPILRNDEFIDLIFTRGIYRIFPFGDITQGFASLGSSL